MKKILLLTIISLAACLQMQAQQGPARWYAGAQAGVPLFWGDVRSIGVKNHLGFGGGLFAGIRATPWLAFEPSIDYGVGKLGASKWQTDDYIDNGGVIRYISGSWKLGNVYSKTSFIRIGVRMPVSIVQMIKPYNVPRFDVELAPHVYFNHFTPGIYAISDNKKLTDGVKPAGWAYAVGGDLAFSYKITPRTALFLRPSVSWLSDERYEGISSDPAWRVNLMAYTTFGLRLDLGKKTLLLKQRPVITPQTNNKATQTTTETVQPQPQPQPREKEPRQVNTSDNNPRQELLDQLKLEAIPVVYFRRGFAVLDEKEKSSLDRLLELATKYDFAPISIVGWCDATGGERINALLSQQRANAVAAWLIQNGISKNRITTKGNGVDETKGTTGDARRAELEFVVK